MKKSKKRSSKGLTRRDLLKGSGLALAGLAGLAGLAKRGHTNVCGLSSSQQEVGNCYPVPTSKTQRYSYFNSLKKITPWGKDYNGNLTGTKLEANEMRITFLGSVVPMPRRAQAEMSIFVEVGWDDDKQQPLDQFIFDFGCGVSANYQACGIGFGRMNKIFINHLHGDHISDLIHVYCFGDAGDRKSPLYIFGQSKSNVPNPGNDPALDPTKYRQNVYATTPPVYDDSVTAFCKNLREALRWHTESFAFQTSGYTSYPDPATLQAKWGLPVLPVPVGDDPYQDAAALIPIELDWTQVGGIAYDNTDTGAIVTHYPVIHNRKGSMGYKLAWTPPGAQEPLTMIYSSDTKPEVESINQANNKDANGKPQGVNVFIHEMAVPPEIWAMKQQGLTQPGSSDDPYWVRTVTDLTDVENSSHTPQGAFGYILSRISPRPRLTVATHFPTADDTVACALKSVQEHCPDIKKEGDRLVWSFDLMVLRVFPDRILQRRAVVNDFSFNPPIPLSELPKDLFVPKYHTTDGKSDPKVQLDLTNEILPTEELPPGSEPTYRKDGY